MGREKRITFKQLYDIRIKNYKSHQEARAIVLAKDISLQQIVARAVDQLPRPKMNTWGVETGIGKTIEDWVEIVRTADIFHQDAWLMCYWYWSEAGWKDLEEQFRELPEPQRAIIDVCKPKKDGKVIHTGVYKTGVIHTNHGLTDVEVTRG